MLGGGPHHPDRFVAPGPAPDPRLVSELRDDGGRTKLYGAAGPSMGYENSAIRPGLFWQSGSGTTLGPAQGPKTGGRINDFRALMIYPSGPERKVGRRLFQTGRPPKLR